MNRVYAPRRHLTAVLAGSLALAAGWLIVRATNDPGVGEWAVAATVTGFLAVALWVTIATYRHRIWISEGTLHVRDHGALTVATVPLTDETTVQIGRLGERDWSVTFNHPGTDPVTLRPHHARYDHLCGLITQPGLRLPTTSPSKHTVADACQDQEPPANRSHPR